MRRFRLHPLRNSGYQLVEDPAGEYCLVNEVRVELLESGEVTAAAQWARTPTSSPGGFSEIGPDAAHECLELALVAAGLAAPARTEEKGEGR